MAELLIQVGSFSAQGKRSNNEDAFVADSKRKVYLVADGMGGQDHGERASGLAASIIPSIVEEGLSKKATPQEAIRQALLAAHLAILNASKGQVSCRRMGTTVVVVLCQADQAHVSALGDSPAYLIRNNQVEQVTTDHTVADALARNGTLSAEQAKNSPWRNVLYRFLGCAEMTEEPEVRTLQLQPGDRLLLASDGLSGFVSNEDLCDGGRSFPNLQAWAEHLVQLALERGSRDNVTVVALAFEAA